jgi:hypothetical protein
VGGVVVSVVTVALRVLACWEGAAEDSLLFPLVRGGVGVGQVFTFLVLLNRTCLGLFGVVGGGRGGEAVELLLWRWEASRVSTPLSSNMSSSSSVGPPPAGAAPAASSTPPAGGVGGGAAGV